jgi:hypothetical protein
MFKDGTEPIRRSQNLRGAIDHKYVKAMKEKGIDGAVMAIDKFLISPIARKLRPWKWIISRNNDLPDVCSRCLSNVARVELADYVIPLPQISASAPQICRRFWIAANIVDIDDGARILLGKQRYRGLLAILQDGGYMMVDDYPLLAGCKCKLRASSQQDFGGPFSLIPKMEK